MTAANGLADHESGLDIDSGFVHKVRPAAGLPPVKTAAPNSVFSMGGATPAQEGVGRVPPARPHRFASRRDRALKVIRSCHPITAAQFSEAMEMPRKSALKLLYNMKVAGQIEGRPGPGGKLTYHLATSQKTSAPVGTSRITMKRVAPPPIEEVKSEPELTCGIFNNGAMLIEVPNSPPLRLTPRQAEELIAYLRTLQGGLK